LDLTVDEPTAGSEGEVDLFFLSDAFSASRYPSSSIIRTARQVPAFSTRRVLISKGWKDILSDAFSASRYPSSSIIRTSPQVPSLPTRKVLIS
jgi:hypothetical protein